MDKSGFEMRARRKDESKNPVLRSRQQECMIFDVGQRDVGTGSLDTRNAIVMSHCDTCASYVPGSLVRVINQHEREHTGIIYPSIKNLCKYLLPGTGRMLTCRPER